VVLAIAEIQLTMAVTIQPVRTISREVGTKRFLTPQRLHAELLTTVRMKI
jgi:hypothetical protein